MRRVFDEIGENALHVAKRSEDHLVTVAMVGHMMPEVAEFVGDRLQNAVEIDQGTVGFVVSFSAQILQILEQHRVHEIDVAHHPLLKALI